MFDIVLIEVCRKEYYDTIIQLCTSITWGITLEFSFRAHKYLAIRIVKLIKIQSRK